MTRNKKYFGQMTRKGTSGFSQLEKFPNKNLQWVRFYYPPRPFAEELASLRAELAEALAALAAAREHVDQLLLDLAAAIAAAGMSGDEAAAALAALRDQLSAARAVRLSPRGYSLPDTSPHFS